MRFANRRVQDLCCRLITACAAVVAAPALAFDESYNFQPGLGLYQSAEWLKDLIGPHGSQLCAPIAITHLFSYYKYFRKAPFPKLLDVGDVDHDGQLSYGDVIRHFAQSCQTDINAGTKVHSLLNCAREYVQASGYTPWFYMVGPHAPDGPNGDLTQTRHMVDPDVIRYYLSNDVPLVMFVGWYTYDAATRAYTRAMGHYFNVDGYDYDRAWGKNRITLKAVNSYVNYEGRAASQMFDDVEMTALPSDGSAYPEMVGYKLTGNGFNIPPYQVFVEDIYAGIPVAK